MGVRGHQDSAPGAPPGDQGACQGIHGRGRREWRFLDTVRTSLLPASTSPRQTDPHHPAGRQPGEKLRGGRQLDGRQHGIHRPGSEKRRYRHRRDIHGPGRQRLTYGGAAQCEPGLSLHRGSQLRHRQLRSEQLCSRHQLPNRHPDGCPGTAHRHGRLHQELRTGGLPGSRPARLHRAAKRRPHGNPNAGKPGLAGNGPGIRLPVPRDGYFQRQRLQSRQLQYNHQLAADRSAGTAPHHGRLHQELRTAG